MAKQDIEPQGADAPNTKPIEKGQGRSYCGPDYAPGAVLHAYDRSIDPKSWTDEEYAFWTGIEPRYKELFT